MQTIEEVVAERDKLATQYVGGLPDYLQDYFDYKLKQLKVSSEIVATKRNIYATSKDERAKFIINKKEKFWRNHKYEIVKKKKNTSNPIFEEPPKGEERIEEDIVLTTLQRKLLIKAAGDDLYLFAIIKVSVKVSVFFHMVNLT